MAPGGGHFQGAFGGFLAFDVGHIGIDNVIRRQLRLRRAQQLRSLEVIDQGQKIVGRQDRQIASPGRLRALRSRTYKPAILAIGVDGGGQHARNRGQRAVQRQLTQGTKTFQLVGWYRPHNG